MFYFLLWLFYIYFSLNAFTVFLVIKKTVKKDKKEKEREKKRNIEIVNNLGIVKLNIKGSISYILIPQRLER